MSETGRSLSPEVHKPGENAPGLGWQYTREWLRLKAGAILCKPFWLVSDVGQAADRLGTRIFVWSERASAPARTTP